MDDVGRKNTRGDLSTSKNKSSGVARANLFSPVVEDRGHGRLRMAPATISILRNCRYTGIGQRKTMQPSNDRLYTRRFFHGAAGLILFMTGVALQFHLGQYFEYLDLKVDKLGLVMAISMGGTLMIRLRVGRWIDRLGCRPTWVWGSIVVAVTVGSIQFVQHLWLLTILQTVSVMARATVMTTMAVFAAQIAPPHRRAEAIGSMGMAGFGGMMLGPTLGDWIFASGTDSIVPYRIFFTASALCSILSAVVMSRLKPLTPSATVSETPNLKLDDRGEPSTLSVVRRHWPGAVLLVGVASAMMFCVQMSFLERLAEERGFKDIRNFFLVYGTVAITLRIVGRRVPERLGRAPSIVGGLCLMVVGLLCLVGINAASQLILPALLMGAGHAFTFPSMVDLAAGRLPVEHRGTGTSLIMAASDMGMLIGFFGLGEVISVAGYDVALRVLAGAVAMGGIVFAGVELRAWRRRRLTRFVLDGSSTQ